MTVVIRRKPRRNEWPADTEIHIRAALFETMESSDYETESSLIRTMPGQLQAQLEQAPYVAEYQHPTTHVWKSCHGWDAPSFGTPQLSADEVGALVAADSRDLATHGEAAGWVAFRVEPEDVVEALVQAGWVPTQAGLDLAIKARRHVDERDARAGRADGVGSDPMRDT